MIDLGVDVGVYCKRESELLRWAMMWSERGYTQRARKLRVLENTRLGQVHGMDDHTGKSRRRASADEWLCDVGDSSFLFGHV